MQNKLLIPISIIIAGVVIGGAFVFVNQEKIEERIGKVLPAALVAEETINYINENLLSPGATAFLVDISDAGSVYKLHLEIKEGEAILGEFDSYVSKDGEFVFPEGFNMKEGLAQQNFEAETQSQSETPSLPQEELQKFVGCLAKADFVIYGANWCGWTQQLVTMLGGWETVRPIYIECTEESELCQEKGITGYPTILINGSQYQGERTFDSFSESTSCQMPEGAESLNQNNPAGGC